MISSFLKVPLTCKQLVQFFVPLFQEQCVSMVASMCCLFFTPISPNSNQSRLVFFLYFLKFPPTPSLQTHVLKCCRLYNIFGLGASHGLHAQFMVQATAFNKGRKIGLLRGAGTWLPTWFYSIHWLLQQKVALKTTIYNPDFPHSTKNLSVEEAIKDIENQVFWKALYCLLHSVFSALKALQYVILINHQWTKFSFW